MEHCDVYLYGPPTDAVPEVNALVLYLLERFGVDCHNATCFIHETPCVYLASWKRPHRMPAFGFRGVQIWRGKVQVLEDPTMLPLCAHSFLIQDVSRQRQRQMRFRTFGIAFGAANYSGERRTLEYLTDGTPTWRDRMQWGPEMVRDARMDMSRAELASPLWGSGLDLPSLFPTSSRKYRAVDSVPFEMRAVSRTPEFHHWLPEGLHEFLSESAAFPSSYEHLCQALFRVAKSKQQSRPLWMCNLQPLSVVTPAQGPGAWWRACLTALAASLVRSVLTQKLGRQRMQIATLPLAPAKSMPAKHVHPEDAQDDAYKEALILPDNHACKSISDFCCCGWLAW